MSSSFLKPAFLASCLLALDPAAHAADALPPGEKPSARSEYQAHLESENRTAAVAAAQKLVETARADGEPLALAEALSQLGEAQLRGGDLTGAEASFKEALELIERSQGQASRHTLNPLRGLGFTLAAAKRHEEAVPYLDRALLITHRTHGLFHEEQQPILAQLANSLTRIGQALAAERHVNYMLKVGERSYGQNDPRIVPLMCQVADWHAGVGNFDVARRHYRDAIRLVERTLGSSHVDVVLPLRRLAASYLYEVDFYALGYLDPYTANTPEAQQLNLPYRKNPRYLPAEGQRALLRALEVLETQPDPPAEILLGTLVETGDWFQFKQDTKKALAYYRQAAQRYAQLDAKERETIPNLLAVPVRVYFPAPAAVASGNRMPPGKGEEAFVELEFTVNAEGFVEDARVTDSNTYSRHVSDFLDAIRDARFRPRFVDGEPVATTGVTAREVYRVRRRPQNKEQQEGEPS